MASEEHNTKQGEPEAVETGAETLEQEEAQGLDADRVAELVDIVRSGGAELPVGAEDFAEALRIVADERDEISQRLLRTAADYQNFQRRAVNNEREAKQLAQVGVLQSLIQVLDFFDMALKQNPETATVQQVIGGVQMIKSEMMRVLGMQGLVAIEPSSGAGFDPMQHEAIEQQPSADAEPGTVLELRSPGYRLGDRVVRPAKVVVATSAQEGAAPEASDQGSDQADEVPGSQE